MAADADVDTTVDAVDTTTDTTTDEILAEDQLVEEVSIDGMCGVY
ncbi:MAG: mycofactocin precursor MftA [Actinomycetota bacterium]|nr:mycofactocin precursor MftA [Actinomycetota bacterium]